MDWVLVILTFYSPNVELHITEIEFSSSRECLEAMSVYEEKWEALADEDFHYSLSCRKKEEV